MLGCGREVHFPPDFLPCPYFTSKISNRLYFFSSKASQTKAKSPEEKIDFLEGPSSSRPRRPVRFDEEFDEEEPGGSGRRYGNGDIDSLEKYRPHNFDFKRTYESSDINDLRDYYSGLATKQRALKRFSRLRGGNEMEDADVLQPFRKTSFPDKSTYFADEDPAMNGRRERHFLNSADLSPEANQQQRQIGVSNLASSDRFRGRVSSRQEADNYLGVDEAENGLDESTKFILGKAKAARGRNLWQDEVESARKRSGIPDSQPETEADFLRRSYDWENDRFLTGSEEQREERGGGGLHVNDSSSSTMSDRTKGILAKLKESTMALEDLNTQATEETFDRMNLNHPRRQKQTSSRNNYHPPKYEHSPSPPPQQRYSLSNGSRYERSYKDFSPPPQPPTRSSFHEPKYDYGLRHQDSQRDDFASSYGGKYGRRRETSPPQSPRTSGWRRSTHDDDDDVDVMIADLKKKTTGRDMRHILSQIEERDVTPPRADDFGAARSLYRGDSNGYQDDWTKRNSTTFQGFERDKSYGLDSGPPQRGFASTFDRDSSPVSTKPWSSVGFSARPSRPLRGEEESDDRLFANSKKLAASLFSRIPEVKKTSRRLSNRYEQEDSM